MVWLVLITLLLIFFLLFLLKVTITVSYRLRLKNTHRLHLKLRFLRIPVWKRTFYLPSLDELVEAFILNSTKKKRENKLPVSPFQKVKITNFKWETGIGIGEAYLTGISAGMIWTGKELSIRLLENYFKGSTLTQFTVNPNYLGEGLYSRLDCTITIPIYTLFTLRKKIRGVIQNKREEG